VGLEELQALFDESQAKKHFKWTSEEVAMGSFASGDPILDAMTQRITMKHC